MKIYEIGTGYTPIPAQMGAATEIVVEELTKSFLKLGESVEIIDIAAQSRRPHQLPIREVKVPRCFTGTDVKLGLLHKLKRVVYSVALAGELKKILRSGEGKVLLHFHNQYNLFFFLKLTSKKLRQKALIAYTNHSYIWHGQWDDIEKTVQKRYFQEIFCLRNADYVQVLNEKTKENLIEHLQIEPQRIFLVDNGVNPDVYVPLDNNERQVLLEQQGLTGKKVFIHVGSVCDRKNQLEAVKLLLPLMQEDPNVVFCYAGGMIDGAYHENIRQFATEHAVSSQVRYLGELQPGKMLNGFYACADAMIFPSRAEGFSLVIIEAMSAGVPVIINTGLHFALETQCLRYEDETHFRQIVQTQILTPKTRAELSQNARIAVTETYGWDKVAQQHLRIWNIAEE